MSLEKCVKHKTGVHQWALSLSQCALHPLAYDSLVLATTQAHKAIIHQLPQLIDASQSAAHGEQLLSVVREVASYTEAARGTVMIHDGLPVSEAP